MLEWSTALTTSQVGADDPFTASTAAPQYQVSLTAGTILHNTKTPLTVWFWAAYLAVTDKRGISALLLQRQLGLSRYETAWMLLHKLRRAMVNAVREPCMAMWRSTTPGLVSWASC